MITIPVGDHCPVYWNAHLSLCRKHITEEIKGLSYHGGMRDLYMRWWLEDYGVVLNHDPNPYREMTYIISMTFPNDEEWQMFRLRWAHDA